VSALHDGVDDYLALRRALGFRLHEQDRQLHAFVSLVEGLGADVIATDLALRWATRDGDASAAWWNSQLGVVRGFARYWSARDPRTQVPPLGLLPRRAQRPGPYLYTSDEVLRLIEAAGLLRSRSSLWPSTMKTLIALLAVTGMRIGEALSLDDGDIDWTCGVITIRRAKFGKSRLVPLHATARAALKAYLRERDRVRPVLARPMFFPSPTWKRLRYGEVRRVFVALLGKVGIAGARDRRGPRLHDFRHRFAVNTLIGWYRAGLDIERHIFTLSTYLGHTCVDNTYWYLSAAPELMGLARSRLEHALGDLS